MANTFLLALFIVARQYLSTVANLFPSRGSCLFKSGESKMGLR